MRVQLKDIYRCPYTNQALTLEVKDCSGSEIHTGTFIAGPRQYPIEQGIPHLISSADETFSDEEKRECSYYETNSHMYDEVMQWLFESFYESEDRIREEMIDLLSISPGNRVLETGCGTCRDSFRMARRLGGNGELFLQEISPSMVKLGRARMEGFLASNESPTVEFLIGNATRLPFPNGYFDAAFHFGGLNVFSDKASALREMARVVRVGGKVVVGDEALAPWLRDSEYGRILVNSNRLYRHEPPIALLPEGARNVNLRWIIGGAFYLIDFRVGQGPPNVDLDKPILGARGGTHRTRYYGVLEGVTPEAKQLADQAARRAGLSLHDWLDQAVRAQARRDIEQK